MLTGASLAEVKKRAGERLAAGDPGDEPEFGIYPPGLKSPYRERRFAAGEQRYIALGIAREDKGHVRRPSPRTGTASARRPPCSATSTAAWARPSGPTSPCTCRRSCCCSAPKGCTAARRWRGRCTTKTVAEA